MEFFRENIQRSLAVNYFCWKTPLKLFDKVLIISLMFKVEKKFILHFD